MVSLVSPGSLTIVFRRVTLTQMWPGTVVGVQSMEPHHVKVDMLREMSFYTFKCPIGPIEQKKRWKIGSAVCCVLDAAR